MLSIIGCGNPNRRDDGVGGYIARSLLTQLSHPKVRVFDAGTNGMEVMFQARGCDKLIVIDAAQSGSTAGAIFCVPGTELAMDHEPSYSLHDFRWEHALAAGRKIFREQFPDDVTVYLIESASLDFGLELSEPVRQSADKVIADISRIIDEYPA